MSHSMAFQSVIPLRKYTLVVLQLVQSVIGRLAAYELIYTLNKQSAIVAREPEKIYCTLKLNVNIAFESGMSPIYESSNMKTRQCHVVQQWPYHTHTVTGDTLKCAWHRLKSGRSLVIIEC